MQVTELAKQKQLSNEEKCIAYLERMRWPEGVQCPTCGNKSISRFQAKTKSGKARHLYQCLDKQCRYQFSPTTGTIFHDSHLPLNKWFTAIALVCESEKPMTANQLRIALGVQYKTAAHLAGRIRIAMERGTIELTEGPSKQMQPAVKEQSLGREGSTMSARGSTQVPTPTPAERVGPVSLQTHRVETASLLNQITSIPSGAPVSATTVDNMLSMFVSLAQLTVRPPLLFVSYLRGKVLA